MITENDAKTFASCALVLRAALSDFDKLKQLISENFPDVTIVYQRTSASHLWIKEGNPK